MAKWIRIVPKTKAAAEAMSQGPEIAAKPKWTTARKADELPVIDDGIVGSNQQTEIWQSIIGNDDHLIVNAYAGTGKTFTMLRGLKYLELSGRLPRYVNVAAFNRAVGKELQTKVPEGVRAGTLHAYGFSTCRYANKDVKVEEDKMDVLLTEIMGEHLNKEQRLMYYAVLKLAGLCKNTLTGTVMLDEEPTYAADYDDLEALCERYDVDPGENKTKAFGLVEELMTAGLRDQRYIDQDDMIWFPVVLNYRVFRVDLLILDEAQDLNACQQQLALKAGKRIMIVGDRYQAIYGFRGADAYSIQNMSKLLEGTGRRVRALPLSKTRRCPKSHVAYVRSKCPWLSEFEALPDAPEGVIAAKPYVELQNELKSGDMVVCRTNAPIVALAFECLRKKKRVKIQGRDLARDLRQIVERLAGGSDSIEKLKVTLKAWAEVQRLKLSKTKSHAKRERLLTQFNDKFSVLVFFSDFADSVQGIYNLMNELFHEDSSGDRNFALLGTAHALKGMEADTVWVLGPEKMPHPMAKSKEDIDQEWNLWYVAHTRSKDKMYLTNLPKEEQVGRSFEES